MWRGLRRQTILPRTRGRISLPDAAYTIELFACVVTDAYDTAIYTPGVTTTTWGRCWTMRRRRPCSSGTSV